MQQTIRYAQTLNQIPSQNFRLINYWETIGWPQNNFQHGRKVATVTKGNFEGNTKTNFIISKYFSRP